MGGPRGGQTREHAQLAFSLGIRQLAVVVSKLDTCDFSQQRFQHIQGTLLPFLTSRQCGFKAGDLQWLAAVGPLGENLTGAPKDPGFAAWFKVSTSCQSPLRWLSYNVWGGLFRVPEV